MNSKQSVFQERGLAPPVRTPGTLNTFTSTRKNRPTHHVQSDREPHSFNAGLKEIDKSNAPDNTSHPYGTRSQSKKEKEQRDAQLGV